MYYKKTTGTVDPPVFTFISEDIPGGVTVKTDRIPSDVKILKAGAPIDAHATTTGLWHVVKTAKLYKGAAKSATTIEVYPGHLFKVGEFLTGEGHGTAVTISVITRGTTYDVLTIGALAAAIATNTVLFECSAAGASANKYTPEALLKCDVDVRRDDLSTLTNCAGAAVVRGTVNESLLQNPLTTAYKTALSARMRFV